MSMCINCKYGIIKKNFLAPNHASLAEAYLELAAGDDGEPVTMFAICNDDEVVGFAMIYYILSGKKNILTGAESYPGGDGESCYYLSRFMFDKRFQGRGFGKAAMSLIIDYVKTRPLGEAASFYTSVVPENERMRKFIAACGFVETGKINEGEVVTRLLF